jgi:hypothetical protein
MSDDTFLKKLIQVCTEDKFSKRNIREKVIKDIKATELTSVFTSCVDRLDSYLNGNYWESKNIRVDFLKYGELSSSHVIAEMFIAVVPIMNPEPIQNTAARSGRKLGFTDIFDGIRTASEILAVCDGLFHDLYKPGIKSQYLAIQCKYKLEQKTRDFIKKTQFLPPLVVKPKEVTCNSNAGWFTIEQSVLLGNQTHHEGEICLDVINNQNSIAFSLDERMICKPHLSKAQLKGIDKANFDDYVKECEEVHQYLLNEDNKFYFINQYDFRGRVYDSGYHVHVQGTEWQKASLVLHDKEVIRTSL